MTTPVSSIDTVFHVLMVLWFFISHSSMTMIIYEETYNGCDLCGIQVELVTCIHMWPQITRHVNFSTAVDKFPSQCAKTKQRLTELVL